MEICILKCVLEVEATSIFFFEGSVKMELSLG